MNLKTRFLRVNKSPYENGIITGKEMSSFIKEYGEKFKHLLDDEDIMKKLDNISKKLEERFPTYLKEVYGRAKGAGINERLHLLLMCAEILGEGVGCTSIIRRRENGSFIIGHNEDDEYRGNPSYMTTYIKDNEGWFTTYDYFNMPFGNAFSYNSSGIIKTINYCHSEEVNLEGIPRYFIQRHITEATSIEDFIKRCNIEDRASGFHAIALDANKNIAVSVEVTKDDISVKEIKDYYAHTNHYVHEKFKNKKIQQGSTTLFRLEKVYDLLKDKISTKGENIEIEDFNDILNYRGTSYEDSILALKSEPNFTCSRIVFDSTIKDKMFLRFFNSDESFCLNYNANK
ncbi:hypothetical protein DP149_05620 [Clostridium tetani]|uniref:Peptidase C45 hydrolase domain-containing protein n=1 Tax=Clostridium tetani (strain Massachusetts / E88) TaxID=212717 RepID=Q896G2_CLOTE|nr:C45 family peptidase [Clostridium tetani]AAO35628.1 hypothetical protein CTC_01045 [Clostridium tetani E88]KGI36972.1 hypothetical protein KY52_11700 [Clostridium tetani]KGI40364.1 hypothetical protein LA33_06885 [Clostridium tetani ATCC 9441]KGI46349.1 hypothetical protein KY54_01750 [Clostridium tetani]KHO36457.1 hypothetical protein OR63_05000 [Clostridium tetani]